MRMYIHLVNFNEAKFSCQWRPSNYPCGSIIRELRETAHFRHFRFVGP